MKALIAISTLFLVTFSSLAAETVIMWQRNFQNAYTLAAVDNILKHSEEKFGPVELIPSEDFDQGRALQNLETSNQIDLIVGGVTREREQRLDFLYLPIDRGLLGFRVCLIRDETNVFEDIRTLEDFNDKDIRFGLGAHWPDLKVFESHGIEAVSSATFANLFPMLKRERFDCLSRSLNEIDSEAPQWRPMGLAVDPHILFVYAFGNFMMVSKDAPQLKARLQYGIEKALEDGSFYEVFDAHFEDIFKDYQMYERRLLFLENKNMSDKALKSINQYGIASFIIQ